MAGEFLKRFRKNLNPENQKKKKFDIFIDHKSKEKNK